MQYDVVSVKIDSPKHITLSFGFSSINEPKQKSHKIQKYKNIKYILFINDTYTG